MLPVKDALPLITVLVEPPNVPDGLTLKPATLPDKALAKLVVGTSATSEPSTSWVA